MRSRVKAAAHMPHIRIQKSHSVHIAYHIFCRFSRRRSPSSTSSSFSGASIRSVIVCEFQSSRSTSAAVGASGGSSPMPIILTDLGHSSAAALCGSEAGRVTQNKAARRAIKCNVLMHFMQCTCELFHPSNSHLVHVARECRQNKAPTLGQTGVRVSKGDEASMTAWLPSSKAVLYRRIGLATILCRNRWQERNAIDVGLCGCKAIMRRCNNRQFECNCGCEGAMLWKTGVGGMQQCNGCCGGAQQVMGGRCCRRGHKKAVRRK